MRAALAYVGDKVAALREFLRILKPGSRISMAEPILMDDALEARALRELVASSPQQGTASPLALMHRFKAAQFPDTEEGIRNTPMTAFSERDLTLFAVNAGFVDIHMEFHIDMAPIIYPSWEIFLGTSPHPLAPSLATILAEKFSSDEQQEFEALMRPRIENPATVSTSRVAFLTARKPLRPECR
jgi:arsenite methyltransferase